MANNSSELQRASLLPGSSAAGYLASVGVRGSQLLKPCPAEKEKVGFDYLLPTTTATRLGATRQCFDREQMRLTLANRREAVPRGAATSASSFGLGGASFLLATGSAPHSSPLLSARALPTRPSPVLPFSPSASPQRPISPLEQ